MGAKIDFSATPGRRAAGASLPHTAGEVIERSAPIVIGERLRD
jgi:hypothetical protein